MIKFTWVDPTTGILSVGAPAYNDDNRDYTLSDETLLEREIARNVPADTAYRIIDDDDPGIKAFLDDRTFRNAWDDDGVALKVDMPKARTIHMDAIRRVRNKELVAKDITFMRAVEAGDTSTQSTIATEKQVLRDIPQTFDLTTDNDTPEELKAKWPTELPARE